MIKYHACFFQPSRKLTRINQSREINIQLPLFILSLQIALNTTSRMSSEEKFCLEWSDFPENIASSLGALKEDQDFFDVTLACEDGQQVEAHKVILAASSPLFKNLLRRNSHSHPLIFLRGVKSETLTALMDYAYFGRASVLEENLNDFLTTGVELQIKGLTEVIGSEKHEETLVDNKISGETSKSSITNEEEEDEKKVIGSDVKNISKKVKIERFENAKLVAKGYPTDIQQLDLQIKSLMSVGNTSWKWKNNIKKNYACTVCGKEDYFSNIKRHIELYHIEGVNVSCSLCEKMYKTRLALKNHMQVCNKS